jgi:hypothetical protein
VIVHDLDILSVALGPSEADTPLIVDSNAHLSCPVSFEGFEPIAGWIAQVLNRRRGIELTELAKRPLLDVAWKLTAGLPLPDSFGLLALERSDHRQAPKRDTRYVSGLTLSGKFAGELAHRT